MKKPIHVLYVVSDLLEGKGGIQSFVMSVFEHIDRSRVQIDFVLFIDREPSFVNAVQSLGGKVYKAPQFKKEGLFAYIRWWNKFFKEHSEYKIVHGHMKAYISLYLLIAKLHKCITIAHSHTAYPKLPFFKKIFEKLMLFPLCYIADYHFACSVDAGKYFYGKSVVKKSSFHFIPNARATEMFAYNLEKRNNIRKELGFEDCFVIGHIGSFTQPKNHHFLLQVFAEIYKRKPNARLLLIGDGPLLRNIQEHTKKLHLEKVVVFMGLRNNPQDYYQAMDVFVLPSLSEGLPLVLVEAQISGVLCVMSAHLPREIDFECGLLHKISLTLSATEWANKILNLPLITRRSYSIQASQKGFEITSLVKQLEDLYLTISSRLFIYKNIK